MKSARMFVASLLLLAQAATPAPASANEVVVVGHRNEKALADCLARRCPPAEEMEATLRASVEQFSDGRYGDARRSLQKAIGRNKRHAAQLPGQVSSLYATLATVAEHEGDTSLWRHAARENVVVLRKHVGEAKAATLGQELAFGDSMATMREVGVANGIYRRVQTLALQNGQHRMASNAAFRRAWVAFATDDEKAARRLADEAVTIAGPNDRIMRELRAILEARIAIRRGDDGAIEALARTLRQPVGGVPRLLFAPPIDDVNAIRPGEIVTPVGRYDDPSILFADVGYWIRPDGRTGDVEILRTTGMGQWKPGILRQIGGRRYVPLEVEPGHPGIYRIDRFTVRGTIGMQTGSRIRQRMGPMSVHVIDLTETEAMTEASRQRTAQTTAVPPAVPGTEPR